MSVCLCLCLSMSVCLCLCLSVCLCGRSLPDDIVIIRLGGEDEDEYEYEEEDQETVTEPVPGVTTRLCDYDRCRHGQRPCAELQLLAGPSNPCLCPGMADEDAPPDPPQLLPPTTITDSSAQLHWCEPLSTVHDPLAPDARLHTLTGLRSATAYRVCVEAFNAAGQSRRLEGVAPRSSPERRHLDGPGLELGPCRRFTTKPSRYTVAAVGASGLLALLLVAVAAGACCRRHVIDAPPRGGDVSAGGGRGSMC
uniref:Fibronectin type-III domain-containing protein n=1 Tax=Callorhinchus milii TaxID=7868 RepID=A0A4W3GK17_CALMI